MGNSKHKLKSTRETQLSANSRAARKRAKQDVVFRMVMTYLETTERGDSYVNVKNINDAISVSPYMTGYGLNFEAIIHKQKIINNQVFDC